MKKLHLNIETADGFRIERYAMSTLTSLLVPIPFEVHVSHDEKIEFDFVVDGDVRITGTGDVTNMKTSNRNYNEGLISADPVKHIMINSNDIKFRPLPEIPSECDDPVVQETRDAIDAFNEALLRAAEAGINVELRILNVTTIGTPAPEYKVTGVLSYPYARGGRSL